MANKFAEALTKSAAAYEDIAKQNREVQAAERKAKRDLRKKLEEFADDAGIPTSTEITIKGVTYKIDTAVSERILPEQWYALWQKGEITKDQYFDAINVNKDDAATWAGQDLLARITKAVPGKSLDVRRDDKTYATEQGFKVHHVVKPTSGIRRRVIVTSVQAPVSSAAKRRIFVRKGTGK